MPTTEAATTNTANPRAVFWDFGGVILSSPFDAFNRYEAEHGLPTDFIRSVNARNPDTNAWALILEGSAFLRLLARIGAAGWLLLVLALPIAGVLWTLSVVVVGLLAGRVTRR